MKRVGGAVCGALISIWLMTGTALACGFDLVTIPQVAREADHVVLGTVRDRVGQRVYTYTLHVQRVLKGGAVPHNWVIRHAGVSDCGMPILDVGQQVVLEYYQPGRVTTGPWFYAWKIQPNGKVLFSDSHEPPLPKTLNALLALYAAVPDTSMSLTTPRSTDRNSPAMVLLALAAMAGGTASWRRSRLPCGRSRPS